MMHQTLLKETDVLFMLDGVYSEDIELPIMPLREQVSAARIYSEYSSVNENVHKRFVHEFARQAADAVQEAADWLNKQSNKDGLFIRPSFFDGNTHGAKLEEEPARNSSCRNCIISIRLGGTPLLIGIANRLSIIKTSDVGGGFLQRVFQERPGPARWNPQTEPIGILTMYLDEGQLGLEETFSIAINALLIIFFHEAAHACAAHGYIKAKWKKSPMYSQYSKTLEAEADWGSGLLFIKYSLRNGAVENEAKLCRDLILGTYCNYIALQVELGRKNLESKNYHLPRTRITCTFLGAKQAWEASKKFSERFDDLAADAEYPLNFVEYYFPMSIGNWLDASDARVIADKAALNTETLGLWVSLRQSHQYTRARPLDELALRRKVW